MSFIVSGNYLFKIAGADEPVERSTPLARILSFEERAAGSHADHLGKGILPIFSYTRMDHSTALGGQRRPQRTEGSFRLFIEKRNEGFVVDLLLGVRRIGLTG